MRSRFIPVERALFCVLFPFNHLWVWRTHFLCPKPRKPGVKKAYPVCFLSPLDSRSVSRKMQWRPHLTVAEATRTLISTRASISPFLAFSTRSLVLSWLFPNSPR
ncbi:hypothetical protein CABS01_14812 [Colletotrichum abscissum]|uniref:uncharacterized protein n=1 Tax=Colletotrichum abscissum TaxID=1671311 RepID=UPI0027D62547|nr:uncharacterized protein CABS01_14812 [Colletotrichum abscissum]KAK1478626.1 hypothetical protein CABS01_14812 [Colletotrichum abscissum]